MRAPTIRGLAVLSGEATATSAEWGSAGAISGPPQLDILRLARPDRPGDRFRRATRECLLALAAVDAMLEDGKASREAIAGERTALLYVTAAAYGASNRQFIERRKPLSPHRLPISAQEAAVDGEGAALEGRHTGGSAKA